jgi:hypothetical protein
MSGQQNTASLAKIDRSIGLSSGGSSPGANMPATPLGCCTRLLDIVPDRHRSNVEGFYLCACQGNGRACAAPHQSSQSIGSSDITSTPKRRQPDEQHGVEIRTRAGGRSLDTALR